LRNLSNSIIHILGCGDSPGVPRVYCDCTVCTKARETGRNRRMRSAILLQTGTEELLVDCGPDWHLQMEKMNKRVIRDVLITHAHHDHIGGLPDWYDNCRWMGVKGHVYAPKDVIDRIHQQYTWLHHHLTYHVIDSPFKLAGWHITYQKVNHGKNGYAHAYRFESDDYCWVYCPDSIHLSNEEKRFLSGSDLLFLGTSYFKENTDPATRSIYDMMEALDLIKEVGPKRVIFTHMSHGVDRFENYPLPEYVELAEDGMTVKLGD
jgi:phosphoribosyl 1,2-cyclic phosphate phosphodiesterase